MTLTPTSEQSCRMMYMQMRRRKHRSLKRNRRIQMRSRKLMQQKRCGVYFGVYYYVVDRKHQLKQLID